MNLDTATWRTLAALLDEALDLSLPERSRWLDRLPGEHATLRPLLQQMLELHASPAFTGLIDGPPPFTVSEPFASAEAVLAPGSIVGRYRLVREIGQGGMGIVWLAERADGLVRWPVALKLPHWVGSRGMLAERFAREREILAGLDHPAIARLVDAGVAEDGQPYLALEYVEGLPITTSCEARGLGQRARIELMRRVIGAVDYAHRHLVLHRDIKPTNILVTGAGEVKLLDFGIAKLMTEGQASQTALTQMAGGPLTPSYASPEQIAGASLTTASDVYSIGVVLYELLTGTPPYRLKRGSRAELEEAILGQEIERASAAARRVSPQRSRELRGDLDAILAKALEKEPRARYPTAHALDEDLGRYLEGLPVHAGVASLRQRALRFVRRHAVPVGVGASVAVLLVSASVVSFVAMQRAERSAAEARHQATRAGAVQTFLTDLFKANSLDRRTGRDEPEPTASALLDRGVQDLDRGLREAPDVRAYLYRLIGGMYTDLGAHDKALATLEKALQQARQASGETSKETAQAVLNLALAQRRFRENEDAWPLIERSRAILSQVAPGSIELAETFTVEANVYALGDPPRAIRAGNEALRLLQLNRQQGEALADTLAVLADAYRYNGQHALAIEHDQAAIEALSRLHGPDSFSATRRRMVVARSLQAQLRLQESEQMLEAVIAVLRARPLTGREEIVWATIQLGQAAWLRGDLASARRHYAQARDENRADAPPVPPNLLESILAYELVFQGDEREARRQLSALVQSKEPLSPAVASLNLASLARAHLMADEVAAAASLSRQAEAGLGQGAPHVVRWRVAATAGEVAARVGDRETALRRVKELRELRAGDPDALMQALDISLAEARILEALGEAKEVRELLGPWLSRPWNPPFELPVPARGESLLLVGLCAQSQQASDARASLTEALALLRRADAPGSYRIRRAEQALAALGR